MAEVPLLVVDGANVVGSVPDGWWRDRHGAAVRLRDALAPLADSGVPGVPGPLEVVLVAAATARTVWVVTADRGLRERVTALGAGILGPRTVRPR